jgi:hypothetical protein
MAAPSPVLSRRNSAASMPVVGVHTSRYVGDGDTCFGRRLLRARDGDETGLALDEQVVGLLVPVRPRSAVAGDVAHERAEVSGLDHRPHELFGVAAIGVEVSPVLVREAGADVSDAPA